MALKAKFIIIVLCFISSTVQSQKGIKSADLHYLKNFKDCYPNNIKLFSDGRLAVRLKSLLKEKYKFLKNSWTVETPIEIKDNFFVAWGCQQHNCSNTNFIIVVDFKKNVIHSGIRAEEFITIYSEDGTSNPEITKWSKRI